MTQRWRQRDPRKYWNAQLKHKFGITADQYDDMLARQDGKCAICGKPETDTIRWGKTARLAVDHDHLTGVVRGLLCRRCNQGIGKFEDDPDMLQAAADYLRNQ